MYEDPIVEEVRETRERLAQEHNFNITAIFEDLRRRQATFGKKLVRRKRKKIAERIALSDLDSVPLHPGR